MSKPISQESRKKFHDDQLERKFDGVWIPKEIYLCHDLSPAEKFLLIEIDSFKECFCSNRHLALHLGVSSSRVSQMISSLTDRGFLVVHLHYKPGKKELEKRVITMGEGFRKLKGGVKYSKQGGEDTNPGGLESCEGSNTSYRNTNENLKKKAAKAASSPPPKKSRRAPAEKPLPLNWMPSEHNIRSLISGGINMDFINSRLHDFIGYFTDTGEQKKSWGMAFVNWVRKDWKAHLEDQKRFNKTKDASIASNLADRSWAEMIMEASPDNARLPEPA